MLGYGTRMTLTLYRVCSPEQSQRDLEDGAVVEVTSDVLVDPAEGMSLYELHPLPALVSTTDQEGVYRVEWAAALEWPHQITTP